MLTLLRVMVTTMVTAIVTSLRIILTAIVTAIVTAIITPHTDTYIPRKEGLVKCYGHCYGPSEAVVLLRTIIRVSNDH